MSGRIIKGFSILFFFALIATIVATLYVIRMKQSEAAAQSFQSLIAVSENFTKTFATADIGSRNRLSQTIFVRLNDSRAEYGTIQNTRGDRQLEWARGPGAKVGTNRDDIVSAFFSSSLAGAGTLNIRYILLNDDDIRLTLVVALIALSSYALILVFIAVLSSTSRKSGSAEPASTEETPVMPIAEHKINHSLSPPQATVSQEPVRDEPKPIETEQSRDEKSTAVPRDQIFSNKDTEPELPETEPKPRDKDSKFILLDRKSGVSQERFLPFRLDKELQRSAENTVDLSLAIVRFPNIGSGMHSESATLLLNEFNHEDLIFEYGVDSFCVILTEHDLDQAIARLELFIRKADQKFTSMPLNANSPDPDNRRVLKPTAGLTSRNGRIIDAKRFLKEAGVALKKASNEEGRIVGFRPDPLRFRHFLRHQRV